jgi:hypothetical protein
MPPLEASVRVSRTCVRLVLPTIRHLGQFTASEVYALNMGAFPQKVRAKKQVETLHTGDKQNLND